MPLSDYEQRVLDEIEHDLMTDDPRLAASITPGKSRITRVAWAIGALVGLGCVVVVGLITAGGVGATLAVVGFVIIVATCWATVRACRSLRSSPQHGPGM